MVRIFTSKHTYNCAKKGAIENKGQFFEKSINFISEIKSIIEQYEIKNIYNLDQSGLEMHSGRTLDVEGIENAECLVRSVTVTTLSNIFLILHSQ